MIKKIIKNIIVDNSIGLTIIYTLGHIFIAIICNVVITGATLDTATLDALIEPCINGIWFYLLHKWYKNYKSNS
jgi:uncharacterized membrane protein